MKKEENKMNKLVLKTTRRKVTLEHATRQEKKTCKFTNPIQFI